MKKKSKDKIRVSFIGGNAEDVTGSCIHIQTETNFIRVWIISRMW